MGGEFRRNDPNDSIRRFRYLCVAHLSPDGRTLALQSKDHHIELRDVAGGQQIRVLTRSEGRCTLAWAPDGKSVAQSDEQTIRVWEAATGREIRSFTVPFRFKMNLDWSPDSRAIALTRMDNRFSVWDVATGQETCRLNNTDESYRNLVWSPDGKRLLSTHGSSLLIWAVSPEP